MIKGFTVVPNPDKDNEAGWEWFNRSRGDALVAFRAAGFNGVRIIIDYAEPPPIGIMAAATALGYSEILLAVMGDFTKTTSADPFKACLGAVCGEFAKLANSLPKKGPVVKLSFNDIDLVVMPDGKPPTAALEREIIAATWRIDPSIQWVRQERSVPLGITDPRIKNANNAYIAAFDDSTKVPGLKALTWPMTNAARDAVLASSRYAVPSWQYVDYSVQGLVAMLSKDGASVTPEFGIPDYYPEAVHLAQARDMFKAHEILKRDCYIFRFYGPNGPDFKKLSQALTLPSTVRPQPS